MASQSPPTVRNRTAYTILIFIVITLGLASRTAGAGFLPAFITTYAGDTLWALMVFLLVGFLRPGQTMWDVALIALFISFSVEVSQLYQADWLDRIRATTPGALVLGSGFLCSDLACYTAGVLLGVVGESLVHRNSTYSRPFSR